MRALVVEDEVRLAKHLKQALQTLPSFAVDLSHDELGAAKDALLPRRHIHNDESSQAERNKDDQYPGVLPNFTD